MNRFFGRLTARGTFEPVVQPGEHAEMAAGCRVVMRGYLADRAALTTRLGLSGARHGDGVLLAHAFRRWGCDVQQHVLGEYAAVIWDAQSRTALLTHDALGVVPLFYAGVAGGLAFATHLIDLVDAETATDLDEGYLADFLVRCVPSGARTPYRTVRRLLPGRTLWWSGERMRDLQTWNLADVAPVRCRNDAEYEERFRTLLEAGVRSALATNGSAWVSLSGGLDSSSIAAFAARAGGVTAYSLVAPRWPDADEQRWISAVVERFRLPSYALDVESVLPFSTLPSAFIGEPTPSVILEAQIARRDAIMRSRGVTALLSGDGGDAVLCASPGALPTHLADPLFAGAPLHALRTLAAWKRSSAERRSYAYWIAEALAKPAFGHWRGNVQRDDPHLGPWLATDYVHTMRLERRASRRLAPRCARPGDQATWDSLWATSLASAGVQLRPAAFDFRYPLMYRPLVEFMFGIPWEQKLRPRCDRYLQRRALAGILPELVLRRASKGSGTAPMVEGLRRSRDWTAYLCDDPLMARRGMINADRWRLAVRRAAVGHTQGDREFLAAVAVETFLKQLQARRPMRAVVAAS